MKPTAARLRELLTYDPLTGDFVWKSRPGTDLAAIGWNSQTAGTVAGRIDSHGHRQISIDGRRYQAAPLAWLYMTGEWPTDKIDHKNRCRSDDRFENLRQADKFQNRQNGAPPAGKYPRGVSRQASGRFAASVAARKVRYYLGTFDTPEEAHAAYVEAARRLHMEFYCGG